MEQPTTEEHIAQGRPYPKMGGAGEIACRRFRSLERGRNLPGDRAGD